MFTVTKIQGVFAVIDWTGEIVIAYKNRKFAESYAAGAIAEIHNSADDENTRRDGIRAYLATRAARPVHVPAQLELF